MLLGWTLSSPLLVNIKWKKHINQPPRCIHPLHDLPVLLRCSPRLPSHLRQKTPRGLPWGFRQSPHRRAINPWPSPKERLSEDTTRLYPKVPLLIGGFITPTQIECIPAILKCPLLPGEDTISRLLRGAAQLHRHPEPAEQEVLIPSGGESLLQRGSQLAKGMCQLTVNQGRTHLQVKNTAKKLNCLVSNNDL